MKEPEVSNTEKEKIEQKLMKIRERALNGEFLKLQPPPIPKDHRRVMAVIWALQVEELWILLMKLAHWH